MNGVKRCVVVVFVVSVGMCQSRSATAKFEVASVKLSANQLPEFGRTGLAPVFRNDTATLVCTHVTLSGLLVRAYKIALQDISGPSWMDGVFYDIAAKVPLGAPPDRIPEMIQALLADRFQMKIRWDSREVSGYALVLGKGNPRLNRSILPGGPSETDPEGAPGHHDSLRTSNGIAHLVMTGVSMTGFAKSLQSLLEQPVEDMTGLAGAFDIAIDCSADLHGLGHENDTSEGGTGPSVRTAVRRLGLDLVSRKIPAKRLVVVSAEKVPTPN